MNRKLLFIDTETAGLPKNWNLPPTDINNWPEIVQIAWIVYNEKEEEIKAKSYIIRPEGYNIPKKSVRIHGITTGEALKNGHDRNKVISQVYEDIIKYDPILVAHCMEFDENVLGASFTRSGLPNILLNYPRFCTMKAARDYCRLPNRVNPGLGDLYRKIFSKRLENIHDALTDARATAACFFKLKQEGVIKISEDEKELEVASPGPKSYKGCSLMALLLIVLTMLTYIMINGF